MRMNIRRIIIILLICTFINCLCVTNFACAQGAILGETFVEAIDTLLSIRDEFIDIVDFFNPIRSEWMSRNNEFMKDILVIMKDIQERIQLPQ